MTEKEDIAAPVSQRLADIGANIGTLFDSLKHTNNRQLQLESGISTTLDNEAERFELWAVNLGLHHFGHSSLDYRLREVDLLYDAFRALLIDLRRSLIQLSNTNASGNFPTTMTAGRHRSDPTPGEPIDTGLTVREQQELVEDYGSDDDQDQESDYDLLVRDVSDMIDRLYKISTKIRTSSTRLRSSEAFQHREVNEDTQVDLIKQFEQIDALHLRELLRNYQGSAKIGAARFLQARLSTANTQRRQQFRHWKQHHDKMTRTSLREKQNTTRVQTGATSFLNQANDAYKRIIPISVAQAVVEPSMTTAVQLTATRIRLDDQSSAISISTYARSEPGMDEVQEFPEPPRSFAGLKYFQCPYCYTLCSSSHLEKRAWRSHLIHDLRPYICTYEHCELGHIMYDRRQDWVEHESSTHRKSWRCLQHIDQNFPNIAAYEGHLYEQHTDDLANMKLEELLRAGETTASGPERPCPMCCATFDDNNVMERHVAKHLERIAHFALPRSTGLEDDKDDIDNSIGQVKGSRAFYSTLSAFSNDSSTDVETRQPSYTNASVRPLSLDAIQHYREAGAMPVQSRVPDFLANLQQLPTQRDEEETAMAADSGLRENLIEPSSYYYGLNHMCAPPSPGGDSVGREIELEELYQSLYPDVRRKVVALVGLSGVGKTHLALEFAERQRETYSSVFWFRAYREAILRKELAGLVDIVLDGRDESIVANTGNEEDAVQKVMKWFSIPSNNKWLLIFDRYEPGGGISTRFDIRTYFPEGDQGSILITTQLSGLDFAVNMRLNDFEDPQAKEQREPEEQMELGPDGDEFIPREFDAEGDKKVDALGYLQGDRQYKFKTFTLPGRGQKLFMHASECARVLGYRDIDSLIYENRSIHRLLLTEEDQYSIVQEAVITARSVFRQFGRRVIVDGRRVRDDYWEGKAREQGLTREEVAEERKLRIRDSPDDIWIAIMGVNEADKSKLIGKLSRSRTVAFDDISGFSVHTFVYKDQKIRLVDMPAFKNLQPGSERALKIIAYWLLEKHKANVTISGLLFLCPISSWLSHIDCLGMFKELCGKGNFDSAVLVSTELDYRRGAAEFVQEEHLRNTPEYWGDMIDQGIMVQRHDGSRSSALRIISNIINKRARVVLQIQREMDMGMPLEDTAAGRLAVSLDLKALERAEDPGYGSEDAHIEESDARINATRDGQENTEIDRTPFSAQSEDLEFAKQKQQQKEEHQ